MFTKILHRPAMAIVISIILLFLGGLGVKTLPVSHFPSIATPTVEVAIAYPGASAEVLVDSVLIPVEQSINGVQGQRYMVSDATSAGEGTIRVFFEPSTDPDGGGERAEPGEHRDEPAAAAGAARGHPGQPGGAEHADEREHLQHRPELQPERPVQLRQRERDAAAEADQEHGPAGEPGQPHARHADLAEPEGTAEAADVHRGRDEGGGRAERHRLARAARPGHRPGVPVEGVCAHLQGAVQPAGRVRGHHPAGHPGGGDPAAARRVWHPRPDPAGAAGPPRPGRRAGGLALSEPKPGIELGSEFFDIYSDVDGHPACSMVFKQNPGSNAAAVIEQIKKELEDIKKETFPPGMDYQFAYDVSKFLDASIEKVIRSRVPRSRRKKGATG